MFTLFFVLKMEQKVVITEQDVDRNLCININEIRTLLDYYPLCNPHRLMFALLATIGMRPCEVVSLKAIDFTPNFDRLKYRVYKPRIRIGTKTIRKTYKKRTASIPCFLRAELKEYVKLNYHTMVDGLFFGRRATSSLEKEMKKIRTKVGEGYLKGSVWLGFIEQVDNVEEYTFTKEEENHLENLKKEGFKFYRKYKTKYRISLHSFRRFYITYSLWCRHKGDIILTAREIGHSFANNGSPITTMLYVYSPDKIGLPKRANERYTFDYFFGKGKTMESEDIELRFTVSKELGEKFKEKCQEMQISEDRGFRKAVFSFI